MDANDRRAITRRTGARVEFEGRAGTVTGHYDDDSVFVLLDGDTKPTHIYVEALQLLRPRLCQRCQKESHAWCSGWQSSDGESLCECKCPRAHYLRAQAKT